MRTSAVVLVAVVCLTFLPARRAQAVERYDIPKLDGITIDGHPEDWGDRGFRVDLLTSDEGKTKSAVDFDPTFRLGWNDEGLLLLATVRDDVAVESERDDRLFENDSLEAYIASDPEGAGSYVQVIFAPGVDPKTPSPRVYILDRRNLGHVERPVRVASSKVAGGYLLEALYPWTLLGIAPKSGGEVWFGFCANDADQMNRSFQVAWQPCTPVGTDMRAAHALRLSDHASPPVTAMARGAYVHYRRTEVEVLATAEQAGSIVEVSANGANVGEARLEAKDGRAHALLNLPLPPAGQTRSELEVSLAGKPLTTIGLPDLEETRAQAVVNLALGFQPSVFTGPSFPECDFDDPYLAEELLGPYTLETTFYDANYHELLTATKPGRYGAVVKLVPRQGRSRLYFRTLFLLPEGMRLGSKPDLTPPPGMAAEVIEKNAAALDRVVQRCFGQAIDRDPNVAALLAGLYESRGGGSAGDGSDRRLRARPAMVGGAQAQAVRDGRELSG